MPETKAYTLTELQSILADLENGIPEPQKERMTRIKLPIPKEYGGDWGNIPKEQWIRNNHSYRNGGTIVSEYDIPEIFCLDYVDRIVVTTNEERTETKIQFPTD